MSGWAQSPTGGYAGAPPPQQAGYGAPQPPGAAVPHGAYNPNAHDVHYRGGQAGASSSSQRGSFDGGAGGGGHGHPQGYGGGGGGFGDGGGMGMGMGGGGLPMSPKSIARFGMGAYGAQASAFVSNNYAKYFSSTAMRYYFDVNEPYVFNKLKLLACPFLHKGSWARIPERDADRGLAFKPPRGDINAPDLYIPLMGFASYVLTNCILQATRGEFTPESPAGFAWRGFCFWCLESAFVWTALRSCSTAQHVVSAPVLDIAAYCGYMFVLVSAASCVKILFPGAQFAKIAAIGWGATAGAVFIVKTTKRIIFSEARGGGGYGVDGSKHNYLLLILAVIQFPLHMWLGAAFA